MSTITGQEYASVRYQLPFVCEEANLPAHLVPRPLSRGELKTLERHMSPTAVKDIANKINRMVPYLLLVYEAAQRAQVPQLADYCIQAWQRKLEETITQTAPVGDLPVHVAVQVGKIATQIAWPMFRWLEESQKQLEAGLTSLLAREIVFLHFHGSQQITEVPPHVAKILACEASDAHSRYLLTKYAPLQREMYLPSDYVFSDENILAYFERFTALKILVTGHQPLLTPACLAEGHPTLEKLVLTGTAIRVEDVPRHLFPKLKKIVQKNYIRVLDLAQIDTACSWREIERKLSQAHVLINGPEDDSPIFLKFRQESLFDGVKALLSLRQHLHKIHSQDPSRVEHYETKIADELMGALFAMGQTDDKLSLELLMNVQQRESLTLLGMRLGIAFQEMLQVDVPADQRSQEDWNRQIRCTRNLIQVLKDKQLKNQSLDFGNLHCNIGMRLQKLESQLFYQQVPATAIATFELLCEVYVELSYQRRVPTAGPFLHLYDPKQVIRYSSTATHPFQPVHVASGPSYEMVIDRALACACVLQIGDVCAREVLYRTLLKRFSEYSSQSQYYPLPRILFGIVREEDIPPQDRKTAWAERLCKYRGVFNAIIGSDLQQKYWDALIGGKMGCKVDELPAMLSDFCARAPGYPGGWEETARKFLTEDRP